MGKKASHKVDWSKLDGMLLFDASLRVCADELGMSHDTLERHIRKEKKMSFGEYKKGKVEITVLKLKNKMINKALKGDNTSLIFSLKNLSDWSDKQEIKLDEVKPIILKYKID
jgi:hypothetical protein